MAAEFTVTPSQTAALGRSAGCSFGVRARRKNGASTAESFHSRRCPSDFLRKWRRPLRRKCASIFTRWSSWTCKQLPTCAGPCNSVHPAQQRTRARRC